jgi:long-chain acyl-CoA synthetase
MTLPNDAPAARPAPVYPSLAFGDALWTPGQLESETRRLARGLVDAGVLEGDVVALMLRNEPAFLALLLACRLIGAYPCAINWHFKDAETRHVLDDSGAKVVFVHTDLIAQAKGAFDACSAIRVAMAAPAKVLRDHGIDAAPPAPGGWLCGADFGRDSRTPLPEGARPRGLMAYTSGTTGLPKGVKRMPAPQDPASLALARRISQTVFGIGPGSRCLVSAPLYHSAPCSYIGFAATEGAHIVLESRFDAAATLAAIEREKISHLYLVPTMYRRLLQLPAALRAAHDLRSVEFVASTGSPCPPDTKEAMIAWWGPVIHETYASSETGYLTFIHAGEWLTKRGSVGRPMLAAQLEVVDEAGQACAPGEVGLIYGRQKAYADFTYLHNDEARRANGRGELVTVGDMGCLDADGYLYLSDRKSDMVISGGVNIYPVEVERVLIEMPGVADCAVFGIPDEEFGEAMAAAVQPLPGMQLDAAAVQQFLKERLAGYKVPRLVAFHDQLPREDSGKIFKRLLRAPYWSHLARKI